QYPLVVTQDGDVANEACHRGGNGLKLKRRIRDTLVRHEGLPVAGRRGKGLDIGIARAIEVARGRQGSVSAQALEIGAVKAVLEIVDGRVEVRGRNPDSHGAGTFDSHVEVNMRGG